MKAKYLIPAAIFLGMVAIFGLVLYQIGQGRDIKEVPSPLIGKPVPQFELPLLLKPEESFSSEQLKGQVSLVNVWASWCVSCRAEHQVLNELVKYNKVNLIGLNYKDEVVDARRWLSQYGDPYQLSISDIEGLTGIDWGVYGVPETFVIDKKGIVRLKHTGPVTHKDIKEKIIPLLKQLEKES